MTVGDPVTPGQIVAKIESEDYKNALRSSEADLASAQAVLANAQNTERRQSAQPNLTFSPFGRVPRPMAGCDGGGFR